MENISGYVTRIDNEIVVIAIDPVGFQTILNLGFVAAGEKNSYLASPKDDHDKFALIEGLRNAGFAFSAGTGWSPAEIVDYERDRGNLSGKFVKISWQSPGSNTVTSF